MKPLSKTIWIVFFALTMGYLETSVVVYLRALYYPEGFVFPLRAMDHNLALTELYRELATLIMIFSVSVLAAKYWLHRFAWFLVIFAVWDIAYYIFLKLLLCWPESFFTTDILFLLPSIWTGPVIAPVINSLTMLMIASAILYKRNGSLPLTRLSRGTWALLITGSLVVLFTYMKDFAGFAMDYKQNLPSGETSGEKLIMILSTQFVPRSFDWLLFTFGVMLHLTALYLILNKNKKETSGN